METMPTAIDLFNRFAPRFSEVLLRPASWGRDNKHHMYLNMYRLDGSDFQFGVYPAWIDLAESNLEINFTYDRSREGSVHEQFTLLAAELIDTHLLAGRHFRYVPSPALTSLSDKGDRGWTDRTGKVEVDGEPIPGFHTSKNLRGDWHTFIPRGSPEAQAIGAAWQVEYLAGLKPRDLETERKDAGALLIERLKAIAE